MISPYIAPWWLGGKHANAAQPNSFAAHAQTVHSSLFGHRPDIAYTRERWDATPHGKPDGDFIDIDRLATTRNAIDRPMLVVFHGLEGGSHAVYARNFMLEAERRGWRGMVPHFRGCSGEINRLPRAYHSGDAAEIDWILRRAKAEAPDQPLYVAAISLGGNATLKWLGEQGSLASPIVTAAAAISAPLDLMAAGEALERGFCKLYTWNFLKTMKRKALDKLALHPGIFREEVARAARTLREYDNEITAPLHGYRDTDDYWTRASSKPGLIDVRVPSLVLNARNDPFLPASALPRPDEVSRDVLLDFPEQGGHVGFLQGGFPGHGRWMTGRVMHFLEHGA
ncbi:MAG: YheT family hydrolase [Burkholderiales bacterium]